jgi:hypothetical protein
MIRKWGGGFLAVFLFLAALGNGIKELREAFANRTPKPMTCSELLTASPAGTWVRVTGAIGTAGASAFKTRKEVIQQVFVPLFCKDDLHRKSVRILLATEEPALIELLSGLKRIQNDAAAVERFAQENGARLIVDREITAMVRPAKAFAQLNGKVTDLAPSFIVLEDGASPSFLRGIAWLVGGLVVPALLWWRWQR